MDEMVIEKTFRTYYLSCLAKMLSIVFFFAVLAYVAANVRGTTSQGRENNPSSSPTSNRSMNTFVSLTTTFFIKSHSNVCGPCLQRCEEDWQPWRCLSVPWLPQHTPCSQTWC